MPERSVRCGYLSAARNIPPVESSDWNYTYVVFTFQHHHQIAIICWYGGAGIWHRNYNFGWIKCI